MLGKWKKIFITSAEVKWLRHINIFWNVWLWILKLKMVTKQLCEKIIQQERQYDRDNKIKEVKNKISRTRLTRYHQIIVDVRGHMNENQQRLNDINQEPGASGWISSLSLDEEGYVLNKQLFWDLIPIRYGWKLTRLPENCECGVKFGLLHARCCMVDLLQFQFGLLLQGGFVTIRYNQVWNITATRCSDWTTATHCLRRTFWCWDC